MIAIQEREKVIDMDDKNLKGLYNTLKKEGYTPPEYDAFRNEMQDDKNLQGVYNTLKKEGYTPPEYNVFRQDIFGDTRQTSTAVAGSVAQQVIGEYDKANLPQSELSPYVRGKGENVEIFGVPFADYKNMPPEEQSRVYSEAIERKKQEEKNVFSNYVSSQLGEIDGELNQRQETVAPAAGSAFIPSTAVAAAQRFGNSDTKETQDKYTSLHAAKNLLDDANKLVEEAKKGDTGFFSSLGRGFKDKFVDTDNWTMGLTDTAYSGLLRKAVEKEEHGEELSPEESKLLDAAAVNMATQAYFSSEMSRGYKAGSMTAESIPFILEFAVNPITSTGNALAKGLLKHGLKRFGSVATSKVAKVAGRLAGDAVAAAGMTATTGLGRVAAGVNERMIGDVQSTVENGEIKYDGRENGMEAGEAFAKSTASNFFEYQSEMVFNAFAGGGKMAKEALGKFVPGFSKLSNSEIAQFIGKIQNNPTVKNIANRTQFHGLLGEYAEEVYNNFANIPLGEMSVEQATDLDQNIDTFLGLAPTSAAFGLLGIGGMGYESYTSKRNLRRFNEGLSEDDKALFDELRQVINTGDKATTKAFVKRTLNDKKLTQEQKKERVFAVQDMEKAKVVEDVQQESSLPVPEEIEANKVDVYRNYKRAERKINSLVPADIIPQLDGVTDVEQFAHDNNLNDNQAMAVSDYLTIQQPYNQYIEQTNQRREEAKVLAREQAVAEMEKKTNQDTGFVVQAKMFGNDKPVYLTGGKLVFGDDGILDKERSTERVYYFDEDKDTSIPAAPDKFDSLIAINSPEEIIAQAETDAEIGYEATEKESLSSPDIPAPKKDEFVVVDGVTYVIEGPDSDNPMSSFQIAEVDENGEVNSKGKVDVLSVDDYYAAKEAELWPKNETIPETEDAQEKKVLDDGRLIIPLASSESEVAYSVIDRNGNTLDSGSMSLDDFNALQPFVEEQEEEQNDDGTLVNPLPVENVSENTPQNESIAQDEEGKVSETEPLTEETPEQRNIRMIDSLPKKKDGKMDYDAFTPQQQYDYTSVTDSEESAANDLAEDIGEREKQLNKMNEQLSKATGIKKVKLRDAIREHNTTLQELKSFYNQVIPSTTQPGQIQGNAEVKEENTIPDDLRTDEDYISWISENSEDAKELSDAYSAAKDLASHEQTLKPWQKELLGRKINPDSFNRFGDRNHVTGGLARAWLKKDGEEIDTLAQELSTFGGEVAEQDIIEFMLDNPNNRVSQISEDMRNLSKRFSEVASKEVGFPVGGPESNTGRLYARLKEADQKLDKFGQQKNEVQTAVDADMASELETSNNDLIQQYQDEVTDDYAEGYNLAMDDLGNETADEAVIQRIEENQPELYHGGFTAEEIDDIYSKIENNSIDYGRDGQTENSGEDGSETLAETFERSEDGRSEESAPDSNSESREENRSIEEIEPSYSQGNSETSESILQKEYETENKELRGYQQEKSTFDSPIINPGEDVLDYANRIAHEKEEYDTRLPFGVLPNAQNEEAIPESEMNAQEEAVHIEKGDKVIEDAQQTLNNIVEEREKVNQTPSEAQKEAGNYKKGHLKIDGYNVSIENPKGSERTGVDAGGQSWSVTMNNDYGYIRGTEGVDGDHIDMFLSDFPDQGNVFVVDQVKEDGSFDEHKVMYGFSSVDEARDAYLANYSPGWKGLKNITEVSKEGFKKWIDSSKRKTKAFAEYKIAKDRSGIDFPNSHVGDGGIIINEDGTPMTLYHGTLNENVKNVTDLEPGHRRDDGDKASFNGSGISFTPSESVALDYSGGKSDKVYHGNITLRKPYYSYGVAGLNEVEAEELTEKLKSDGHDGIIVYASPVMRKHGDTPIEVIVFSKNSIIKINDDIRFREKDSYIEEEQAIVEKATKDGSYMKAPNGKKTNLTDKQWVQVRTKTFKNWFGDWENNPMNASKMVDKNGEPLVVYHGTLSKSIERFRKDMIGSRYSYDESGFFFTDKENIAKDYSTSEFDPTVKGKIIPVYLNIRKPIVADNRWAVKNGLGNALKNMDSIEFWDNYQSFMLDEIEENKSDGAIINDGTSKMVVVFEPNQIKSSTENIGEFSSSNDAIRFRDNSDGLNESDAEEAVSSINSLSEALHTPVRVARTISDVPDGVAKRAIEKGRNIKGWYDPNTGEVVVYLPNTDSAADAQATILHEVVAHKGLKEMLGKESFDELCGKVFDALPEDVRNGLLEKHGDRLIAGDEYMASIAESDIEPSLWEKIKSFVRDAFRKIGVDLSVSDNDIRYLLWKSKNRLMSRDNGMDLVNKVAADENMKEMLNINEYSRIPEQEKADYDRATKVVSDFTQSHAGAGNTIVIRSQKLLRNQLKAIGMRDEHIREIEKLFSSGSAAAVYNEDTERIIILNSGATDKDLNGYLWHENTHKAIREIFGDEAEEAIDPVYEWLNNRKSDDCRFIRNLYSESTDAVQKEECVVAYFEKMFSVHGEDRLKEIINDASSLELSDFFNKAFNNIVYGTEEEGNKGNRSLGRGFQTELEVRNSGNAGLREKKEGAGSEASRAETETGEPREEGVRFREEESDDVSDGTREAYEKAINTKGSVGKAHLSAYNFQEAFQDETLSVKILQKIIEEHSGEKLKGFENAYLAENRLGSTNLQQRNKFIEELYEPMMKIVDSLVKKGVSEKEIKNYLIAKSGLERNREFAVRDAIASAEKDDDKEATQKLRKQYEDNRNILRRQHAEGKLGWDEYQDKLDELAALYTNKFVDYSGLTAITGDETHFTDIAKDIVKEFETKQNTDALWNSVNAATKFALKKSYDSGITSKEAYNHVSNMFEYYIPMRGWSEETAEDVYDYINQDRGTFSATIEKAEGHLHESYDPFAIIGNMAESAILQGNRNLMKQKFMNMVINHPSDVAKLSRVWFKQSGDKWEASFPDIAKDATADEVAQAIEAHEKEMLDLEKDGKAECRSNKLDINYHITPKNISQHAVIVKRGGKDYVVYINGNPRAAEALNGKLKMSEQNIGWSFYDYLKRMYAAGMTSYNINFVGANVSRDIQHAFFITYIDKGIEAAAKLAKNGPRALKTVSRGVSGKLDLSRKEDVYYNEFLENGGETGYSNLNSIEEWKADNDKRLARLKGLVKGTGYAKAGLNHLKDWFEFANRIAENSTRFNAYMLARESGKGVGEAINEAKNITVNFNKKGSSQTPGLFGVAANIFRRWVLFANPIIQGMYQVFNISKQHKARAASTFAFHTAMGIAVPMLNTFLVGMYGDDDDEYFNQNDFTRRNNLMLYIPRAGYLKIPLAPIFRNMYAMGDILYMKMNGLSTTEDMFFDSVKEARAMFSLEGQSGQKEWSPARFLLPDLVWPILDVAENENFSGAPIYKSTEFNKLDPEFKKIYKDAWAPLVELSRVMNTVAGGNDYRKSDIGKWANPAAMQHLITNYTGGVGQLIGDVSSAFSDVITGDFVENFDMMKVPVAKRFFTIPSERTSGTAIRREYFKIKDEMDALNHEVKERAKNAGGDLKLLDELSELQNSKEYDMLLDFKKSSKGITKEESPEKKVERMKVVNEWYNEQTKKK